MPCCCAATRRWCRFRGNHDGHDGLWPRRPHETPQKPLLVVLYFVLLANGAFFCTQIPGCVCVFATGQTAALQKRGGKKKTRRVVAPDEDRCPHHEVATRCGEGRGTPEWGCREQRGPTTCEASIRVCALHRVSEDGMRRANKKNTDGCQIGAPRVAVTTATH